MKNIFLLQWKRFRREPVLFFSIFGLTVLFVGLFGGFSQVDKVEVPTYFDPSVEGEKDVWLERLNEADTFEFIEKNQDSIIKDVALGYVNYGLEVSDDNYTLIVAAEHQELVLLDQFLKQMFTEEVRINTIASQIDNTEFRNDVLTALNEPPLTVEKTTMNNESRPSYDARLQALFGMTLFFAIYTVFYSLMNVAREKRTGTWNRIILSPVKKWQMYFGNMAYAFIIGFVQISLIFLLFKYMFNFPLGDSMIDILITVLCYCFAIVALGMLVLGLSKTVEHLSALVPIVAVSFAMLGGAFWPLEIVSNNILLMISKVIPVTYGMEALTNIALGGQNFIDVSSSLALLILLGVLFMGIGINLMERRA